MADQEIKTSIDALVAYLTEHGESNVTAVASALGVSENVVLGWANVLEKAKVIRILHKSGRVFLAPLHGGTVDGKDAAVEEGSSIQEEKSHTEVEIASQVEVVNQVSARIDELSKSMASIDAVFNTKYKNVKKTLDRINSIDSLMDKTENKVSTRSARMKDVSDKVQKDVEGMQKYVNQLEGFSVDTNNASAVSQELHALLKSYEKNETDMSKSLEGVIYQYRKNALDISRSIREKREQLRQVLEYEDKQIRQYERGAIDYKRNADALVRRTKDVEKNVMDEINKGNAELDRLAGEAVSQIASVRGAVDGLKTDLGGISDLNAKLQGLRKDLSDVSAMRDSLLTELRKLQQEIKDAREEGISPDIRGRTSKAVGSVASLKGKMGKVEGSFKDLGNKKK